MITWLQDTFGKHHRTLLGALLVVIIGSFVFYGYAGRGAATGPADSLSHKTLGGIVDLTDARASLETRELAAFRFLGGAPDDYLRAAQIAAFNQKHGVKESDPATDRLLAQYVDTAERLAAADAIGVPRPDEKELTEHIRKHRHFMNGEGKFSPESVKQVARYAHDRLNMNESRLQNAIANDRRTTRLAAAVQPDDAPALGVLARHLAESLAAKWTVESAIFARDGYTATIAPDEKALAEFFETVKENHRIPKRVKLRYARIPGAPFDAAAKPTDDELTALAARRKDLFPLFGSVSNPTFVLANRTALETAWRQEKSGESAAAKISESLAATMPLGATRPDNAAVDAMIRAAGLTATAIPAYGADSLPKIAGIPEALLERALDLSPQRWRTAAIPYGDAAYVFLLDEEIPSRLPALAEVRDRVEAERVKAATERRFADDAKAKALAIAAAVKAGKTFAEAATEAGLKPETIPAFEFKAAPETLRAHLELLRALPAGGVSPALRAERDMRVVRIVSRVAPTLAKDDPTEAAYRRLLGTAAARSSLENTPGIAD